MSADENEKTSVVSSETFKIRMSEAENAPPAFVLLMGPTPMIGKQWYIEKSEITIGRNPDNFIFVEDRSVSKKHVTIHLKGNEVSISDLGSTNGTEVSGRKLNSGEKVVLINNDQVKIGNVIFKFLEKGNIETVSSRSTFDKTQLDPLTNIFNKGALLVQGEEVFRKATMTQMALSVIVFDLDNFKTLNDTYGHQAGDYVLRELSDVITNKLIRKGDFFARFGGEEFSLILLGGNLQKGFEVAERIRQTIESHPFEYKGTKLKVTISAGVACLEASMAKWDELFEKADKASYVSKKNGKNKVSTI
jgi:two-component system cell cycle response regulator